MREQTEQVSTNSIYVQNYPPLECSKNLRVVCSSAVHSKAFLGPKRITTTYHTDLSGHKIAQSVEPADVSFQVASFTFPKETLKHKLWHN